MSKNFYVFGTPVILAVIILGLASMWRASHHRPHPRHHARVMRRRRWNPPRHEKNKLVLGKFLFIFTARDFAGGDPMRYLRLARKYRIDSVAVKVYDIDLALYRHDSQGRPIPKSQRYPLWMPFRHWGYRSYDDIRPFVRRLVRLFHADGRRVYTWSYNYPWSIREQVRLTEASLALGVDGHIFDIEEPFERAANRYHQAVRLARPVREYANVHCPWKLLAWTTYDSPDPRFHPDIPWEQFNRYCDILMPQVYWKDDPGKTPWWRLKQSFHDWLVMEATWRRAGAADCIKPILPIGQCYGPHHGLREVPPRQILDFAKECRGYFTGIGFWDAQTSGPRQLDAIRRCFGSYRQKEAIYRHLQAGRGRRHLRR